DPFKSHTATTVTPSRIMYGARELDAFNIRYILLRQPSRIKPPPPPLAVMYKGKRIPLAPLGEAALLQAFDADGALQVRRIGVRFATYRFRDLDGEVHLRVRDGSGQLLAE